MAKTLPPVRPNVGIAAAYRKRLDAEIAEMQRSVVYWLRASYRANTPEIAQDASPSRELVAAVRRLARRWQKRFDELAPKMAEYFAQSVETRSTTQMRKMLKDAGWTVKFTPTRTQNDVFQATVAENVGLIKSIPGQYFTQVQGLVMRSVQQGRDLSFLTDEMEKRYGVTRRRAAFIARDQNNKATSALTRVRQQEMGITEALWIHSHAGKEPRPTHVANDGKPYKISEGWLDPALGYRIWPGTEPNCRCVSRSVIPGFS